MDQSKKTMRHFYCRDVLWETFEQMANDFDCSIDYLINESMRYYARSKNYPASAAGPTSTAGLGPAASPTQGPGAGPSSQAPSLPPRRPAPGTVPPSSGPVGPLAGPGPGLGTVPPAIPQTSRRPAPPTPAVHLGGAVPTGQGTGQASALPRPGSTTQGPAAPPVTGNSSGPAANLGAAGSTLYLMFNGQRFPVTKDQFIIGRGSKTSDLPIKDGNISRKHAAVIRRNGTFYIKDLGSTNGIDYKGMRIDNKRIDEGDVFHLCDYELKFTYRSD